MRDNLSPASAVIPELRLAGGLHTNADVRLSNGSRGAKIQAWRFFPMIDPEDMSGDAVETCLTEVHRLVRIVAAKEQADSIGSVG